MRWNRYVSYLWTFPFDVTIWLVWLIMYALWGTNLRFEDGSLVFNLKKDSRPARTWYKRWGGTTLGHAIMYNWWVVPDAAGRLHKTQVHERFHTKQYEAYMLGSFLQALVAFTVIAQFDWKTAAIAGIIHWWSGYLWMGIPNWLSAWQRGERVYRDSHHEVGAYALDKYYQQTGEWVLDKDKSF